MSDYEKVMKKFHRELQGLADAARHEAKSGTKEFALAFYAELLATRRTWKDLVDSPDRDLGGIDIVDGKQKKTTMEAIRKGARARVEIVDHYINEVEHDKHFKEFLA